MTTNAHKTTIRLRPVGRPATAITVAVVVLSMVACGQSKATSQGTAASGARTSSGQASEYQQAMLEWTRCMRANGVPDFPDPDAEGRFRIPKSIDVNSAAFKNARKACADKFPDSEQTRLAQADTDLLNQALEYAQCMRANGVPGFPDPKVVNGSVIMTLPAGVDQNSDAFKKAEAACGSKRPSGWGG
jgi:hypothetical protein